MATDMRTLIGGLPTPAQTSVSDARDRQQVARSSSSTHSFESMLGRADERRTIQRRGASSPTSEFTIKDQSRTPSRPKQEPATQQSERRADGRPQEQVIRPKEAAGGREDKPAQEEGSDGHRDSQDQPEKYGTPVQEAMVVAMNAPMLSTPLPAVPGSDAPESDANTAEDLTNKNATAIEAASAVIGNSSPAARLSLPVDGQATVVGDLITASDLPAETQVFSAQLKAGNVPSELQATTPEKGHPLAADAAATKIEEFLGTEKTEPDKVKHAIAAVALMKQDGQVQAPVASNHTEGTALVEAMAQGSATSGAEGSAAAEQHLAEDSGRFSDSTGESHHPAPDVPTAGEGLNRPLFLDRINGLGQPAGAAIDDASRGQDGAHSTGVLRASDADRLGEFGGTTPFSQTVTLDLDPLDMGPLRVRVMMNDQTVHAHIRTEHGELGQGLLQQGQSLESSLRTTGLEMGMLRVTVDLQQGRGENAWIFQQQPQSQNRSSSPDMSNAAAREEERGVRAERGVESNERVSIFA